MIQKQSGFSRVLYNEAKNGAYYTDVGHSRRIGRLFRIQKDTCMLEPSIGDGSAVEAFLEGAEKGDNQIQVFGVDIDKEAYEASRKRKNVSYCLNADFLSEVKITGKTFSLCFCNPPYIRTGEAEIKRMEQRFTEKIYNYLKADGYLVLVISFPTLGDYDFLMSLLSRYNCEGLWRFDEEEYIKYKQVVFIGKKKLGIGIFHAEFERFLANLKLEKIPFLPELHREVNLKYEVGESLESEIELFMETRFRPEEAFTALNQSPLYRTVLQNMFIEPYAAIDIGNPPLPLKKDLAYLCAISGGGQGLVGSEEMHDLHLQRGSAKVIEESNINTNDNGDAVSETVETRTQISLHIIENDGRITVLK